MVALFSLLTGATLFAGFVLAQNPPQCALTCATNAAANSTCQTLTNLKCLCNNETFFDAAGACTIRSCPPDQVKTAQEALQSLCKSFATTTFSLDTSTISYTGSVSGSSSPASNTSVSTTSGTGSRASSGTGSRTSSGTPTSSSVSAPSSTTIHTSTTSKGAAGKRAETLGSIAGVGPAGVMAALGMAAGVFVLAL